MPKRFTEVSMKHFHLAQEFRIPVFLCLTVTLLAVSAFAQRRQQAPKPTGPWMDTSLSPDQRADLLIKEMTLDEKIAVLHGVGMPTDDPLTGGEYALEQKAWAMKWVCRGWAFLAST